MVGQEDDFEPQPVQIGKGVITATRADFVKGFETGERDYIEANKRHAEPYVDVYVTELFLENLEDITLSSVYSIGYAAGWLHALATKGSVA